MKEIVAKTLVSAKNSMNIYRGCTHGCIYCDSRSEVYGKTYDFEDVEVKVNAVQLLEKELSKRRKKCMITTGAMTDPYLPIEAELCMTRRCLEVIEAQGYGVTVLTKSDLMLRDLNLLQRIHQKTKCVVQVTMTTYDEDLCRIVEPHVCTTKRRFEALKHLQAAGIPTIVWMTPTLPWINDNKENVAGLLGYCKEAGVKGILTFGMGMTLRYGNREYFYQKLEESFPGLKREYMKKYGASYGIGSPNSRQLNTLVRDFCKTEGILYGEKQVFAYLHEFPEQETQLSLF